MTLRALPPTRRLGPLDAAAYSAAQQMPHLRRWGRYQLICNSLQHHNSVQHRTAVTAHLPTYTRSTYPVIRSTQDTQHRTAVTQRIVATPSGSLPQHRNYAVALDKQPLTFTILIS